MIASVKLALFLTIRYIRSSALWTTFLIIGIMALTFTNLVFVNGLLIGVIDGALQEFRNHYSGDVILTPLTHHSYIENSNTVIQTVQNTPGVRMFTQRYIVDGTVQSEYQTRVDRRNAKTLSTAGAPIVGIQPTQENRVTNLKDTLIEGSYLSDDRDDEILLGAGLVERYSPSTAAIDTLTDIHPGDRVILSFNGIEHEVTVRGIVETRVDTSDLRVYMSAQQLQEMLDQFARNVDEVALRTTADATPRDVHDALIARGVATHAEVDTWNGAIGSFLKDFRSIFGTLGNIIGSIGLIITSVTVFIIIFIRSITNQKSIGILKGIGIREHTIWLSYVLLALFYAIAGIILGLAVLYGIIVPYFFTYPIRFPFSDGIVSTTPLGTTVRAILVIIVTMIAGYIPAKYVSRKPAVDAIRKR